MEDRNVQSGHPLLLVVLNSQEGDRLLGFRRVCDSEAEVAGSEGICVLMTDVILTATTEEADPGYWCHLLRTVGLPP